MFTEEFQKYDYPLLGLVRLPKVEIGNKEKKEIGLKNCSNYEFLSILAKKAFQEKKDNLPKNKINEYYKRLEYELEIFEELGFTDYVLLVWKVVNKLKELGGFVDYGRGSCAASFVFAVLGITGILDVIDKGLIFERFISRVRSKKQVIKGETYLQGDLLCDVDQNCGGLRENIVEWLNEVYKGKVCKIAALSTMTGKILIKDVYKTINEVDEEEAKRIADLVEKHFGVVEDIEKMPEKNEEFKQWAKKYPETFQICLQLRDLIRQKTSHASGYFISYYNLDGFVPLELNKEKELTLAYEMNDAAKLGIKLDLLGLAQNVILTEFFKDIKEKPEDIELDTNPIVYDNLQNESILPYGLYQISADTGLRVTKKIKPKNIFELSDINAIARPGALDYLDSYVENNAECPHPIFKEIVKPTRNLFLYQEQLMQALVAVGFTLDEAEICRKIVGKKLIKEVKEWEEKIYDRVKKNKLPEEIGKILWKILNDSAKYSFGLGHSMATSKLSALTVWCKYKHPLQFYKACLNATKSLPNPIEEIAAIQSELKNFNIKLLAPHVLKSKSTFEIEGENIRFSLNSIKGISDKTLEKLRGFCHEYSNKFEIFQAAKECGISINVTSNLIWAGCLDDYLTDSRSWTVKESNLYSLLTDREKERVLQLGPEFKYNLIEIILYLAKPQNGSDKPFIKPSRYQTLKKDNEHYKLIYEQNSKNEELCRYVMEKSLLGFSYSHNLIDILRKKMNAIQPIDECLTEIEGENVIVGGEIIELRNLKSRNGNKYIKAKIGDGSGYINSLLFQHKFEENNELNDNKQLEVGDIIICEGIKKENDTIFANKIRNQNVQIWTRKSDIKDEKYK